MTNIHIVLTLHENDAIDGHILHVAEILHEVCGEPQQYVGAAGYLNGWPNPADGYIVVLSIEKANDDGALFSETDVSYFNRVLSSHPNVKRFIVGPIETGLSWSDEEVEKMLVRKYWETEPS